MKQTIDLYPFNELSAAAQEVARNWYRKQMQEDFHVEAEMITDGFIYKLSWVVKEYRHKEEQQP